MTSGGVVRRSMLDLIRSFVPPLTTAKHKGEMGRLAIIGGSREYTGAPYFAAMSALCCGADIVHIICAGAAAPIIKMYSPELIVHPDLDSNVEEAKKWLNRAHAALLGPGLGLGENIPNATELLCYCCEQCKPLVIDADGLSIITRNPQLVQNKKCVILTPNVVEFERLCNAVLPNTRSSDSLIETESLAKALGGVTIVRKGPSDVISNGEMTIVCEEDGSPRRCGGQGDLLSGAITTFSNWFHRSQSSENVLPFPIEVGAAFAACTLTRASSRLAFADYGRSMLTSHMIPHIQHAFTKLFDR